MAVPFLFDRGVSFRGDLSYYDIQKNLTQDDIMILDYLGIGEQAGFMIQQLELNVNQINTNDFNIGYNFQYLHGSPDYSTDFSDANSYAIGDYVTLNTIVDGVVTSGNELAAIQAVNAGPFNADQWREVSTISNYELININREYLQDFIDVAIDNFQFTAYGGITLDAASFPFPDIILSYQLLNCFDEDLLATPKNITQSISNSSISINETSVYEITASLSFSYTGSIAARTIFIRAYNATDSEVISKSVPVFISINQLGTNFSHTIAIDAGASLIGKEIVLQIGGGDTVADVEIITADLYIKSIGEYRTAFP